VGVFLLIAAAVVEVESPSGCPNGADVQAQVASLIDDGGASFAPDHVLISSEGTQLVIQLKGQGNLPTIQRVLPASGSCSDRAYTAAVIIARWETEIHHEVTLRPPPASPPVVAAQPSHVLWDVGGGFVTFVAGGAAFGGMLEAAVSGGEAGPGARVSVAFANSRNESLGMGTTSWRRVLVAAGGRYRIARGNLRADITADLVGGFLSLSGTGYPQNMSDSGFDPGLSAGARLGRTWGKVEAWVSASGVGWLKEERLHVSGLGTVSSLPRAEVLLGAGLSWSFAP
jgi:hypothetical protein